MISSEKRSLHAKCTACFYDFTILHGGIADVLKHVRTQKHMNIVKGNEKVLIRSLCLIFMKWIKESLKQNVPFCHIYWVIIYH